jgi:hypothetical protein
MQDGQIKGPIEEKINYQNVENQNLDRLTFTTFLLEAEDWTH